MDPRLAAFSSNGFDYVTDKFGIWLVYTRSDRRFLCQDCYNIDTHESVANCSTCFGTGYKTRLERWFAVYSNSLLRGSSATPLTRIGWTTEHTPYVFVNKSLIPTRGDRFFVVEWDQPPNSVRPLQGQPVKIFEALRITFIEPNQAGTPIYFTCSCEFVTEAVKQYEQVLIGNPITISRGP